MKKNSDIDAINTTKYLCTGLQLKVTKKKNGELVKRFQTVIKRQGKIYNLGVLGVYPDMSFSTAKKISDKKIKEFDSNNTKDMKFIDFYRENCVNDPRNEYVVKNLRSLWDIPLYKLKLKHLIQAVKSQTTINNLQKSIMVLDQILTNAKAYGYLENNPIYELKIVAKTQKKLLDDVEGEYTWIDSENDLKALICYIKEYNIPIIRDMMKFCLCTALRNQNVINLRFSNIKLDENGGYLQFESTQTKRKRIEYLGLPSPLHLWLASFDTGLSDIIFLNKDTCKPYTTDYLSKSYRGFIPQRLCGETPKRKYITPHSMRKIFSTFCNELFWKELSSDRIEEVLWHRKGSIRAVYNKNKCVEKTRYTLEIWLNYVEKLATECGYKGGVFR